jgi:hypothetical protein
VALRAELGYRVVHRSRSLHVRNYCGYTREKVLPEVSHVSLTHRVVRLTDWRRLLEDLLGVSRGCRARSAGVLEAPIGVP